MKNKWVVLLILFFSFLGTTYITAQSISGKVYIDINFNGLFDGSDYGIGGIPIYLVLGCTSNGPKVDSVKTDNNGNYQFADMQTGNYSIHIRHDNGFPTIWSTLDQICCLDIVDSLSMETCDFGYIPPNCTSNPYSVDNLCDKAYVNPLCDLTLIGDFPCGQNPSVLGPWKDSLHCDGKFDNTTFFSFVAGSGNYNIGFTVFYLCWYWT